MHVTSVDMIGKYKGQTGSVESIIFAGPMTSERVSNEAGISEFAKNETSDDEFFVVTGKFVTKVF